MRQQSKVERGSILIMVTLALIAMCGLMGLAVDLGWSYYVKKSEQAAADSAALAAVVYAKQNVPSPYDTCGTTKTTLYCNSTPTNCSTIKASYPASNASSACLYAEQNGFVDGVSNVSVTVAANITTPAPTVPGVKVTYWFTVRVNQRVAQLFSAVLGNTSGLVSARATAALTDIVFKASLDLLNRENDPTTVIGKGVDLKMSGGGNIQSPGGMYLASNLNQPGTNAAAAEFNGVSGNGAGVSNTPFSYFRDSGVCLENNGGNCQGNWIKNWTNGKSGTQFDDPTASFKNPDQPSLSATPDTTDRVVDVNTNGGLIGANNPPGTTGTGAQGDPYVLPTGNYYAASCSGSGASRTCTATGAPMQFDNKYYCFGSCTSTVFADSNQWVFFGGLSTVNNTNITVAPGRYVFAGTTNQNPQFSFVNGTSIQDTSSGTGYPGELFLFTNQNYQTTASGSAGHLGVPAALSGLTFNYGAAGFKGGNDVSKSTFNLHGLDQTSSPADLQNWAPFMLWQDRGDSTVVYTSSTGIPFWPPSGGSCVSPSFLEDMNAPPSINNTCARNPDFPDQPAMYLQAAQSTAMSGAVYQPRGAWLTMQGGGNISGKLQIITGALNDGGSGTVILQGISNPITVLATALIE